MKLVTEPLRLVSLVAATLPLHLVWVLTSSAQDTETRQTEALLVFLDCVPCNDDYLRQEITYLNYVVDSQDAQVT